MQLELARFSGQIVVPEGESQTLVDGLAKGVEIACRRLDRCGIESLQKIADGPAAAGEFRQRSVKMVVQFSEVGLFRPGFGGDGQHLPPFRRFKGRPFRQRIGK
ncbi:MAG: hypothetical protein BWY77_01675 [bacterium ADurb.Bin431]|nr:MAG: hypothetical protein BWY77_01675 [bacterium ADurb.Bin431]